MTSLISYEEITVKTNGNWAAISKAGYKLISVYSIRSDSSYYIKGINRRSDGVHILIFDNVNSNVDVALSILWIKL